MQKLENVRIERDKARWEVVIHATVPKEEMGHQFERALEHYQREAQLPGFRKGHAPLSRVLEVVGEQTVLQRAAEEAIQHELPHLLVSENAFVIEAPKVVIETLKKGEPMHFSARGALVPEIKLPDYDEIAKQFRAEKTEPSVSDTEVTETLTHLRRERARIEKIESGAAPKEALEHAKVLDPKDLPELDDPFVQTLGYEHAAAFTEAVRSNIKNEKGLREAEVRRAKLLDELVAKATIFYPASLKEYELKDMEAQFAHDLSRAGMTMDSYLAETKKTREELVSSWDNAADKRARTRLVLSEIARKEEIEPEHERVEHELKHMREHHPNTSPEALRSHIAHVLRNEKTVFFLETGEKKPLTPHHHHDHHHHDHDDHHHGHPHEQHHH